MCVMSAGAAFADGLPWTCIESSISILPLLLSMQILEVTKVLSTDECGTQRVTSMLAEWAFSYETCAQAAEV